MSDLETILKFLTEMRQQDNRATAFPIYYVIRTEVEEPAPEDNCDYTKWYWSDRSWDSWNEIEKDIEENYDKDDWFDAKKRAHREAHQYGVRKRWDERNMFLTESEAQRHLEANHYHYSHNAHTYVHHAWRAPQLEEFFKALFAHFEIPEKK